jgi:hypothetical protein
MSPCSSSLPRMDVSAIEATLGRVEEGLREARAAVAILREGDTTAMENLDAVVDALAGEVAELKGQTSSAGL